MTLILSGSDGVSDVDGSASTPAVRGTDTNTGIFFPAADTIAFAEGGTEIARFDSSGNFGIGTSSPAAKLQVTVSPGAHRLGLNGSDVNYNVRANAGSNASITWTEDGISDRWTVGCVNGQDYLGFRAGSSNMSNGTEQARITAAGLFQFNSGYGSVATAYGCRAWVNFNGTGTPAIRGSGNVSSITDNSQGDFTVNFTNAMPDAVYATVAACSTADSQVETVLNVNSQTSGAPVSPTTTATRMVISKSGVGRKDPEFVCVSIFR